MERFAQIPILLDRHPEVDITSALDAIDVTLPGEPVELTRAICVAGRTGVVVACANGIELGWISPVSLGRLALYLDNYKVVSANYLQPMFFGCMIILKLVRCEMLSGEGPAPDRSLQDVLARSISN